MLRGPALQWGLSAGWLVVKMTHRPRLTPPETVSPAALDFQQEQQHMVTSPSVLLARCLPAVADVPLCTRVKRLSGSRRCPEPITCRGFISPPLHPPWCLFATPWTVAHQAPLSMGFSRQEYWRGLPFSRQSSQPRDWTRVSLTAGGSFTIWAVREARCPETSHKCLWVVFRLKNAFAIHPCWK